MPLGYQHLPLYRFVSQKDLECTQSGAVSRQGQMRIACHEREIELFKHNQTEVMNQPSGQLMPEITALIGDMFVAHGDNMTRFSSSLAPFNPSRKPALRLSQVGSSGSKPARIIDLRTITKRQQPHQAHIAADFWQTIWISDRWIGAFTLKQHIPAGLFTFKLDGDPDRFCRERAGFPPLSVPAGTRLQCRRLRAKIGL